MTHLQGIEKIISIFNGNIQLEKVFKRFKNWVHCYNTLNALKVTHSEIQIKPRRLPSQIQLNQSWLAGFFDAEGGFYAQVGFIKPRTGTEPIKSRLRLKGYLDQKNEKDIMYVISQLFEKNSLGIRNETKNLYRVELTSKKSIQYILNYFTIHKLRSKKQIVYAMWKKFAHLYLKNQHLKNLSPEQVTSFKKRVAKIKYQSAEFARAKTVLKKNF